MSVEPQSAGANGTGAVDPAPSSAGTALILTPYRMKRPRFAFAPRHVIWGTGFLLAIGLGGVGLASIRSGATLAVATEHAQADASTQLLHKLEDEVARLKGSVDTLRTADASRQDELLRGLRKSVDNLKSEIEQVKTTDGATLAQLSTKLDKTDHDPNPKLAEIMARLEKIDRDPAQKTGDGAAQKLSEVQSRLDRIERQVSSPSTTGTIPVPPRPTATPPVQGSAPVASAAPIPVAKPAVKQDATFVPLGAPKTLPVKTPTVDGWVLRDVYDGLALVEARGGGLREIAPGEFLPGVGEIRSIERRGQSWVVLTSRGVIENNAW